jgi:SAM-dependent methyltransferase
MNSRSAAASSAGIERMATALPLRHGHHYIALSFMADWMGTVATKVARGVFLDYGCGGQPYRELFASRIERYIGADIVPAANITPDIVFAPGEPLPLPGASVDTILSTQVLEHVADYQAYLEDCRRLLKPQGYLIITIPMQWRHHEAPADYWRFTRYGISHVLQQHAFGVENITPCGGVYALLGQIFTDHLANRGIGSKRVYGLVNRLALWLDRRIPDYEDTLGWMCIAKKL